MRSITCTFAWARGKSPRMCVTGIARPGTAKSKITHILAKRLARHYSKAELAPGRLCRFSSPSELWTGFGSFTGLVLEALNRFGNPAYYRGLPLSDRARPDPFHIGRV